VSDASEHVLARLIVPLAVVIPTTSVPRFAGTMAGSVMKVNFKEVIGNVRVVVVNEAQVVGVSANELVKSVIGELLMVVRVRCCNVCVRKQVNTKDHQSWECN
jgi:hypothetical protein